MSRHGVDVFADGDAVRVAPEAREGEERKKIQAAETGTVFMMEISYCCSNKYVRRRDSVRFGGFAWCLAVEVEVVLL